MLCKLCTSATLRHGAAVYHGAVYGCFSAVSGANMANAKRAFFWDDSGVVWCGV